MPFLLLSHEFLHGIRQKQRYLLPEQVQPVPGFGVGGEDLLGLVQPQGEGLFKDGVGDDLTGCMDIAALAVGGFGDAAHQQLPLCHSLAGFHHRLPLGCRHRHHLSGFGRHQVAGVSGFDHGGEGGLGDGDLHPASHPVEGKGCHAGQLLPHLDGDGFQVGPRQKEPVSEPQSGGLLLDHGGVQCLAAGHVHRPEKALGKEQQPGEYHRPDHQPQPPPEPGQGKGHPVFFQNPQPDAHGSSQPGGCPVVRRGEVAEADPLRLAEFLNGDAFIRRQGEKAPHLLAFGPKKQISLFHHSCLHPFQWFCTVGLAHVPCI